MRGSRSSERQGRVIDNDGKVRVRIPGPLTPENWQEQVEPLLAGQGKGS